MRYEIPLRPKTPQMFSVPLGTTLYVFRLHYADSLGGGWVLDIGDARANALVCGIPLVTGCDLLEQFPDIGFQGKLYVVSDGEPWQIPTWDNLGQGSHLYFEAA